MADLDRLDEAYTNESAYWSGDEDSFGVSMIQCKVLVYFNSLSV